MVELLGFDLSVVELVSACAIAALVLCCLLHLLAALCGWDAFFSCYVACGRQFCSCCGARETSSDVDENYGDEDWPSRTRTRRRAYRRGGGGNTPIVGPLVTVTIQHNEHGEKASLIERQEDETPTPQKPDPAEDIQGKDEKAVEMPALTMRIKESGGVNRSL